MASAIATDGAANRADDANRAIALRRVRDIHALRDGLVAALRLPDQIKFRLAVEILRSSNCNTNVGYPDFMAGSVSDADIVTESALHSPTSSTAELELSRFGF